MTNINDLRKQHEENVRWNPYATRHTWDKADVDALFAEIDRLTNENAALRSEVQRHKDRVDEVWGKLDGETKASFAMRWIPEDLNLSVTRTSSHTIEVATPTPPPADAPTAPTRRPIPVLPADQIELLDDMLAYDPDDAKTLKRDPAKHALLSELEKHGLVFWYKEPGEGKAWTLSSWGRTVAAHYNVAEPEDDDDDTPILSDTTDWCAFTTRPFLPTIMRGCAASDSGYGGFLGNGRIVADERSGYANPFFQPPSPAAPTPAAAAAQAALRGHTFEKPKAAELTRPQRRALTMATTSKTQWVYRGTSWNNDTGEIPRGIFDTLMKMKLLQLFVPGETFFQRAVLSDAGLDALRGAK